MKIVILDAFSLGSDVSLDGFSRFGEVTAYPVTAPDEIAKRIAGADVVITNKCRLNGTNLSGSGVKLILEAATGFDNLDIVSCRGLGIAVCNAKGYSTPSVVQITLASALALASRLPEYSAYVSSGEYTASGLFTKVDPPYFELSGRTWGIVGAGNIGNKVAAAAQALGCEILTWQRRPSELYRTVSLDELFSSSDVISLHVPLTDATRGLVSEERIALMKPSAILINAARGPVADEAAVAKAVLDGRIGGLGSDVFSSEPMPADHPYQAIRHLPNVILTPHIAWASREARERLIGEMILNLEAFLQGEKRCRVD